MNVINLNRFAERCDEIVGVGEEVSNLEVVELIGELAGGLADVLEQIK